MASPVVLLIWGIGVLVFLAMLVWPEFGLLARINRLRRHSERVLMEDALKYVFDCGYKNIPCGLDSVAGNLHISADRAARLIGRLEDMGLLDIRGPGYQLTDEGRSYALRIIRIHRVWEQYLAEETSIGHAEWHGAADHVEHTLTHQQTEQLAARLGNPVFDPHGDPIPSARGQIPEPSGCPLTELQEGEVARIIHMEDEPLYIYDQLVALGLYPGIQVYIMDVSDGRITFAAGGAECVLTQVFAAGITVERLGTTAAGAQQKPTPLSTLTIGEEAIIAGISPSCRGQQRRRLMDLGIVPGTPIRAELQSASGDPTAYRIMGATIGIRRAQAEQIWIENNNTHPHEQPA